MKLCMICACLVALFIFSAVGIAEILPWGDGSTSGSASASASHGNYYNYDPDSGDNGYYTTVAGYFSYHCEAMADIEAYLNLYDGWGRSTAIARGDADGPEGGAYAYLAADITNSDWVDPDPDMPDPYNGYSYFNAYTGVYASWDVVAECQIEEGTWSNAFAWSYAYASASM